MGKWTLLKRTSRLLAAAAALTGPLYALPVSAYNGSATITPAETNLASKSWVTAEAGTGRASLAVDQNESTYWDAGSVSGKSWIKLDLGGTYPGMRKVEIAFPSPDGKYNYKLEGSADGSSWVTLSDHAKNAVLGGEDVLIKNGVPDLRYLKATLLGVSSGAVAGVSEIRADNVMLKDGLTVGADMSYDTSYPNRIYTTRNDTNAPSSDGHMIGTMHETGMSSVRFRIWNDPRNENTGSPVDFTDGSMNPQDTLNKSVYANSLGMKVGLDFHYSDSWADPGKQIKPKAWKDLDFKALVQAVYDFTYKVTDSDVKAGVVPSYVQVGNETINGMLWGNEKIPTGNEPAYAKNDPSFYSQPGGELLWEDWGSDDPAKQAAYNAAWDRYTALVDAGLRAAKAASPNSKTQIHVIVDAGRLDKTLEFWRQLTTRLQRDYHNNFDIMAISYYPEWHGTIADLNDYLHAFASEFPGYELTVAETAFPASGTAPANSEYPYTVQGQADFMKDVLRACNDTINHACSTVLVWEPAISQSMFTRIGKTSYYQANDSTRVFHAAFSDHIQKSSEYVSTRLYEAPALPAAVDALDTTSGAIQQTPVTWDAVPPDAYAKLGSFTVKGVSAYGTVTAHVAVTMDAAVLENLMQGFETSGALKGPLAAQLANALSQAQHQWEKGSKKKAVQFMEKYVDELNKPANQRYAAADARQSLAGHAQMLIEAWEK
ncbi:glycosyl hydrolase 53 family protein [Paenibacillus humicola]|uniref:glycosyl hydrolase 53 family protein n=1 Tax=Paenibacillus humicola TaxID=3110540 RepID=UPI00237B9A52|nr:glycosyl hydrolase 53 family protein [Paenibacillus humicola]